MSATQDLPMTDATQGGDVGNDANAPAPPFAYNAQLTINTNPTTWTKHMGENETAQILEELARSEFEPHCFL